ncbi:hypothetical protein OGATHE_002758 [Ogataea polymorpha]|uniref:Uncharacterized protein n=1 Tax=Ogataea polymorpha TaxID=460523 RepID=A0A9P8PDZ9_9ASCO|nr:hypothetical protein OGATHE_002758 [Ogataea polymorpha]
MKDTFSSRKLKMDLVSLELKSWTTNDTKVELGCDLSETVSLQDECSLFLAGFTINMSSMFIAKSTIFILSASILLSESVVV